MLNGELGLYWNRKMAPIYVMGTEEDCMKRLRERDKNKWTGNWAGHIDYRWKVVPMSLIMLHFMPEARLKFLRSHFRTPQERKAFWDKIKFPDCGTSSVGKIRE